MIIGNFEIDLGYYSFISKLSVKERLKVVLSDLKRRKVRTEVHQSLQNIIEELEQDVNSQMSKLSNDNLGNQSKSIINQANILNKINTIGNTLASNVAGHQEVHKQDSDQKVINNNDLLKALEAQKPASQSLVFANSANKLVDTNKVPEGETQNALVKSTTEANQLFTGNAVTADDNEFVIRPKYRERPVQQKKGEKTKSTVVNDEEVPLNQKNYDPVSNLEEYNVPDPKKYRCVGYDSRKHKQKHYRLYLDCGLEESPFKGSSLFNSIPIFRGKRIKSNKSWIERMFTSNEQFRKVGDFRSSVGVIDNSLMDKLSQLQLDEEFTRLDIPFNKAKWLNSAIDKDILQPLTIKTTVYILDAMIYESMDYNSKNDPYLIIKIGDKVVNDSANYIQDQDQPIFNKKFT